MEEMFPGTGLGNGRLLVKLSYQLSFSSGGAVTDEDEDSEYQVDSPANSKVGSVKETSKVIKPMTTTTTTTHSSHTLLQHRASILLFLIVSDKSPTKSRKT